MQASDFARLAIECGALRLDGPFQLKSGTESPYFFNTGAFASGRSAALLGEAFAEVIASALPDLHTPDALFGPAYKGIPLAVTTAIAMHRLSGRDVPFIYDRKEAKTHGENSAASALARRIVGPIPAAGARVVVLDDVLTTAGTKHEALTLLRALIPDLQVPALVVALDREERQPDGRTAAQVFTADTGIPVHAVLRATQLVGLLERDPSLAPDAVQPMRAWLQARLEGAPRS